MPNLQAVRCKMLFFYGVALIRFIFPHAVCLGLRGGGRDSWGGGLCWHMVFKLPGRAAKGDET